MGPEPAPLVVEVDEEGADVVNGADVVDVVVRFG
jgi:hypothetical protein